MSLPLLGANGRMLVAPSSKDNNVPISGGGLFSNTWIDREFDTNPTTK